MPRVGGVGNDPGPVVGNVHGPVAGNVRGRDPAAGCAENAGGAVWVGPGPAGEAANRRLVHWRTGN